MGGVWLKQKLLQRRRVHNDEELELPVHDHDTPQMFGDEGGAWVDVDL